MVNEVFFYYANIVDYIRLALIISSFSVALKFPYIFLILYAASQLMDMLDGHLARKFNQCTKFGAVFDMFVLFYH
jgi:CDP-diacylglycerol--inositol 3-phosphatidyltransferase